MVGRRRSMHPGYRLFRHRTLCRNTLRQATVLPPFSWCWYFLFSSTFFDELYRCSLAAAAAADWIIRLHLRLALLWRCTLHSLSVHFITILRLIYGAHECRHFILTFFGSQNYRNQAFLEKSCVNMLLQKSNFPCH